MNKQELTAFADGKVIVIQGKNRIGKTLLARNLANKFLFLDGSYKQRFFYQGVTKRSYCVVIDDINDSKVLEDFIEEFYNKEIVIDQRNVKRYSKKLIAILLIKENIKLSVGLSSDDRIKLIHIQ